MVKRVVTNSAVHGGEIQTVHPISTTLQVRTYLVEQRSFAIQHNIGALSLQQVRQQMMARFAAAGTAQNQNVVVQSGLPAVSIDGLLGGKQVFALIGASINGFRREGNAIHKSPFLRAR